MASLETMTWRENARPLLAFLLTAIFVFALVSTDQQTSTLLPHSFWAKLRMIDFPYKMTVLVLVFGIAATAAVYLASRAPDTHVLLLVISLIALQSNGIKLLVADVITLMPFLVMLFVLAKSLKNPSFQIVLPGVVFFGVALLLLDLPYLATPHVFGPVRFIINFISMAKGILVAFIFVNLIRTEYHLDGRRRLWRRPDRQPAARDGRGPGRQGRRAVRPFRHNGEPARAPRAGPARTGSDRREPVPHGALRAGRGRRTGRRAIPLDRGPAGHHGAGTGRGRHPAEGPAHDPDRPHLRREHPQQRRGRGLSAGTIERIGAIARQRGLPLHLDGARLFNAVAATGTFATEYAKHFTTVSFCLSKGLGAPAGSLRRKNYQ